MFIPYYKIEQIAEITKATAFIQYPSSQIDHLLTDSRKIVDARTSLFFALSGNRDAHQFIDQLYQAGVRNFVVSKTDIDFSIYSQANFLIVENSLSALQSIAQYHRRKFDIPVIGITGSNGKTIVKEWLYQLLVPDYKLVRSPKSYNSQVGVPLSVWQMNENYDLAIFEAGISVCGEMEKLEAIISPTIGVFTTITAAHDEGFDNWEQKLNEKLFLFKQADLIVIDKKYIRPQIQEKILFTYSFTQSSDLQIINIIDDANGSLIEAVYDSAKISIYIPFKDQASIENAVICWATLLALGLEIAVISERMQKLLAVKMRLELKAGIHQSVIIDDSYNSDFSSLAIALDFLNQQNQHQEKTLILSDIHQTGIPPKQLYSNLAQLLKTKGIKHLIGIGDDLCAYAGLLPINSEYFLSTENFLESFDTVKISNHAILIKGARHFGFERISQKLTQKVHNTVLEINLNALNYNLNYYKSKVATGVKIMAMVKAFAYGSGSHEVANLLQYNKIDYLAVAYPDEGIDLRKAGITLPIMVLSPDISSFKSLVDHQLEPELFSFRMLSAFTEFCNIHQIKNYPVHVKLDTGMRRLGFEEKDIDDLIQNIKNHPAIQVKSIFSHLVASDSDAHIDFTKTQIELYKRWSDKIESALAYKVIKHLSNTSAISKWPQAQFDMVRVGIGLYGIDSIVEQRKLLQNVATLKTTITQIKSLKKGDTVGYNRAGVMPHDGKIATVKIGYADGYPRALGNGKGNMLLNGKIVKTIGNICMDMCMIDITGVEAEENNDVIIFGEDMPIYEMAGSLNTIPYEILTNISQRVKRVYYYE